MIKKILIFSSILFLSGCSLIPTDNTDKTYTFSNSIWKSENGGKTWQAKNKTMESPKISDLDVLNLDINPFDSAEILVGLKEGGFIQSKDKGESWGFTNFVSEKVYGLSFSSIDGRVIYASGVWQERGKVFKSENAGQDWKEIYTAPADGPLVISLVLDVKNPDVIYITTSSNEVLKSLDGGNSWKNIFQSEAPITKIAIDSGNSSLLYLVALDRGIYRSRDGGNTFEDISEKISSHLFGGRDFGVLEIDPSHSNWVYLAGKSGIMVSRNAGEKWEKIMALSDPASFPVSALAINPKNSNEIIYGAAQAVYRSEDAGVNWTTFQFDVPKSIRIIKYDPKDPSIVYLGFKK